MNGISNNSKFLTLLSVDQRSLHSFCKIIGQLVLMEVVTVVVVVVVVVEQKSRRRKLQ